MDIAMNIDINIIANAAIEEIKNELYAIEIKLLQFSESK